MNSVKGVNPYHLYFTLLQITNFAQMYYFKLCKHFHFTVIIKLTQSKNSCSLPSDTTQNGTSNYLHFYFYCFQSTQNKPYMKITLQLYGYLFHVFHLLYAMFWATCPSSDITTTNKIMETFFKIYTICNTICQFWDIIQII